METFPDARYQFTKGRCPIPGRPTLLVPQCVVAPAMIASDIGVGSFKSMHCSPRNSREEETAPSNDDDAGDEPPDLQTYQEYIEYFDMFMWNVEVHPEALKSRVADLRKAMVVNTIASDAKRNGSVVRAQTSDDARLGEVPLESKLSF